MLSTRPAPASGTVLAGWHQGAPKCQTIRVLPAVGDFVPQGAPLVEVLGAPAAVDEEALRDAFSIGIDRTQQQDLALGFRHLADIAVRALSSGINDPTTAVQALDYIHDLLRRLVVHPLRPRYVSDGDGNLRVVLRRMAWNNLLEIAVTEIRQYGHGSVQVMRRLLYTLEDLLTLAPPHRRASLERQRALVLRAVEHSFAAPEDRALASCSDPQGLGTRVSAGGTPPSP